MPLKLKVPKVSKSEPVLPLNKQCVLEAKEIIGVFWRRTLQ